jgi:hypothetical protein
MDFDNIDILEDLLCKDLISINKFIVNYYEVTGLMAIVIYK